MVNISLKNDISKPLGKEIVFLCWWIMHLNLHILILSQVKLCLYLVFINMAIESSVPNLNAIIPTVIFQTKTKIQIFQDYLFAGEILIQTRRWVATHKYLIDVPMICRVTNIGQYYATLDSLDVNLCSILWSSSCCADVFIYIGTSCCKLGIFNINLRQNL